MLMVRREVRGFRVRGFLSQAIHVDFVGPFVLLLLECMYSLALTKSQFL
jgi:hypothetical protein